MPIIAVYHSKGGVGKTATTANLGYCAARDLYQTLICDLDPQGSVSFFFRIRPESKLKAKKFVERATRLTPYVKATDFPNLDLLPAHASFRNLDLLFDTGKHPERALYKILKPLTKLYSLILLDCPPNLTRLSENILFAADLILIPVIPTTLAVRSYESLLKFMDKQGIPLSRAVAFFSMVEAKKVLHKTTIAQFERAPGFMKTIIPYSSIIEQMGTHRAPVPEYAPKTVGARAYRELWSELKVRLGLGS